MKNIITNLVIIVCFGYATYAIGSYKLFANTSEEVAFVAAMATSSCMLYGVYALIENVRDYFKSKK
jgi:cation transport ATPase